MVFFFNEFSKFDQKIAASRFPRAKKWPKGGMRLCQQMCKKWLILKQLYRQIEIFLNFFLKTEQYFTVNVQHCLISSILLIFLLHVYIITQKLWVRKVGILYVVAFSRCRRAKTCRVPSSVVLHP